MCAGLVEEPKVLSECVGAEPIILGVGEPDDESIPGRGCFDEGKAHNRTS